MIQPLELSRPAAVSLHGGARSTTTDVWEMLCASREGDLDRVSHLVSQQPALRTCQYNYTPPLHFAVREGHVALVRSLIVEGAFDPRYKTYPFGDSLMTMAQDRNLEAIAGILEEALGRLEWTRKLVDTGEIDYGQSEEERRFDKDIHDGNVEGVERILAVRPELARNEMSSWAEGTMMMPARGGDRRMLELLLRHGAKVPAVSKWGRFYYFKHTDIAAFLLQRGMSARHMNWQRVTLLHDMAQSGDIDKAQLLIEHGADIDVLDEEYRSTPLGLAARWGHRPMVAFLLKQGANPNRSGAAWSTPVAWAQKKGHTDIVSDLLAAGATDD